MKVHIVEAQVIPQGIDVHLAHALGIVSGFGEFASHGVRVSPGYIVLIAYPAVMALFHAGVQGCPGSDTAWAGAVGPVEIHAPGSQGVKVGGLHIRVSRVSQGISPELIRHQ